MWVCVWHTMLIVVACIGGSLWPGWEGFSKSIGHNSSDYATLAMWNLLGESGREARMEYWAKYSNRGWLGLMALCAGSLFLGACGASNVKDHRKSAAE